METEPSGPDNVEDGAIGPWSRWTKGNLRQGIQILATLETETSYLDSVIDGASEP